MDSETIILEEKDKVATVTLNRPPMNPLNRPMYEELNQVSVALTADPAMKVVVITGAGEKAFAAGLDVKEVDEKSLPEMMNFWPCSRDAYERVAAIEKPVIAAKLHVDHGIDIDIHSTLIYEGECFTLSYTSEDGMEGLSFSVEKHKPQFKNR